MFFDFIHYDIKIVNNTYQYLAVLTVLDYDNMRCFIIRNSLTPCSFPFIVVVMFSLWTFTLPVACVCVSLYGACPPTYLQHIYYFLWCLFSASLPLLVQYFCFWFRFFLWGLGLIWGGYFGIPCEPTVITLKELYKIDSLENAVSSKN